MHNLISCRTYFWTLFNLVEVESSLIMRENVYGPRRRSLIDWIFLLSALIRWLSKS